jgi:predicted peroxiredoxin
MDMSVTVFFFTDGTIIAKAGAAEKISEEIGRRFESIANNRKVEILVCEEAARKRGITHENLEDGLRIAGYSTFLDIAVSADTVITL